MRSAAFLDGQAVQAASAFSDDEDSDDEETPNRGEVDGDVTDGESVERSKTDTNDNVVAKGQPTNPETRTETYYWYQSEDGQPVVLHSVCLKLLTAGLGGDDALPVTISAPVLCAEKWTQTLETRKRMTHLRHLPLTTEFTVVDLVLQIQMTKQKQKRKSQPRFRLPRRCAARALWRLRRTLCVFRNCRTRNWRSKTRKAHAGLRLPGSPAWGSHQGWMPQPCDTVGLTGTRLGPRWVLLIQHEAPQVPGGDRGWGDVAAVGGQTRKTCWPPRRRRRGRKKGRRN